MTYLNTENNKMLAEIKQAGIDLTIVHDIDFFFNFTKKKDAEKMQREVEGNADISKFSLIENDTNDGWILCCTLPMVPTSEALTLTEMSFDEIAMKYEGESDGWGMLQPE